MKRLQTLLDWLRTRVWYVAFFVTFAVPMYPRVRNLVLGVEVTPAERGYQVAVNAGCFNCHGPNGIGGTLASCPGRTKLTSPDCIGFLSRATFFPASTLLFAGGNVLVDRGRLAEHEAISANGRRVATAFDRGGVVAVFPMRLGTACGR